MGRRSLRGSAVEDCILINMQQLLGYLKMGIEFLSNHFSSNLPGKSVVPVTSGAAAPMVSMFAKTISFLESREPVG